MNKQIIIVGVFLVCVGLFWPYLKKIPLGSLPGDISFKSGSTKVYFPLMTCIVASIFLSFLMWVYRIFMGK